MAQDDLYAEPIDPGYVWPSGKTAEPEAPKLTTDAVVQSIEAERERGLQSRLTRTEAE